MNNFTLSRSAEAVFPTAIRLKSGRMVPVDADFRTVLRCFNAFEDPNLTDDRKIFLLIRWFFKSTYVPNAGEVFASFVFDNDTAEDDPASMDFEQDADAIYASFMEQYHIDLFEIPYMHWKKFVVLLGGLSDKTALGRRISIRDWDTSQLKGEEKIKADKAKRRFALKQKISAAEKELQKKLDEALANGEDPSEVLKALKAMYGGDPNG